MKIFKHDQVGKQSDKSVDQKNKIEIEQSVRQEIL